MSDSPALRLLAQDLQRELTEGILPYWLRHTIDERHGGFVGLITGDELVVEDAAKGSILNARILWTFSAAYRALGHSEYAAVADRAAIYIQDHFLDPVHGGVYWMVGADGTPQDARKHVYAQAFAIYGFSEHARATACARSLANAVALYGLIEAHAADRVHGGYQEAFSRDWVPLEDVRLSDVDADERKSMNTHLHVLEAYTNLYRIWPDPELLARLRALIELFLARIVDPATVHLLPFFDDAWAPRSRMVSFGHDIEASWLLLEAADAVGDPALRQRVRQTSLAIAEAVLQQGVDPEGGLFYEVSPGGPLETHKEWWPQAEAIVGFVNAHQETGREDFLQAAQATWDFTRRYLVDSQHGEWFRRVSREGVLEPEWEKVGPWKCPYHNARACLELMARAAHRPIVPAG